MKCLLSILLFWLCTGTPVLSQEKYDRVFARMAPDSNRMHQITSTGFSGTGANIDVLYHRATWTVDPSAGTNYISGSVVTHFKTIVSNVGSISFDFNEASFNNELLSVTSHGISCNTSFAPTGNVLNITLPSSLAATGTIDSVVINYGGMPDPTGFPLLSYTDQFGDEQLYIASLSESYEDKDWWPCKADMQDKVDSMDINVTVPWSGADTFWVASNGILKDSAIAGNQRTFRYQTRYPIASYLVCLAAAKYNRYYSRVAVGEKIVPVYWYLLAGRSASYYTNAIAAMTLMNQVVQAFGSKFGDYPFKEEKHGYYDGLEGAGGMEHQTFSAISSNSLTNLRTLDHELMHQWFGDHVTFATWNDLSLAEGFATFGEVLAAELVPALNYSAYGRRNAIKNSSLNYFNTSAWIPNSNIGNSTLIWNTGYGGAVYVRGGMVVMMLRAICGDDKFFEALRIYNQRMGGKAASSDTLKNIFNEVLGTDLSEFFNDYVGGSGYASAAVGGKGNPINTVKWNTPAADKLLLGIENQDQTTNSNVAYFNGPVVVRAVGDLKHTTITFFDWGNGNLSFAGNGVGAQVSNNVLSYHLSFTPYELIYDDSARTMSTGYTIADTALKGYVWYGSLNSDWFNAANWAACCGVPSANADVTIATITNAPVLPASVTVGDLTINEFKHLAIAANTLTINGAISGAGNIMGSSASKLILAGKTGLLNLSQGNRNERSLQSLLLLPGSSATLGSNAEVTSCTVSSAANLVLAAGVTLTTR